MNNEKWIKLFARAFKSIDDRLGQVAQLQSCREHWIQAEISLYAYYHDRVDIWTDGDIGDRRKADIYALDDAGQIAMVAEVKCLSDRSQAKCLEGTWSVNADIERLRSVVCTTRIFILVIPYGEQETTVGKTLREKDWSGCSMDLKLDSALIRMWIV
jgi:hypothetical protein